MGESSLAKQGGLAFTVGAILPSILTIFVFFVFLILRVDFQSFEKSDLYFYVNMLIPPISFCTVVCFCFKWSKKTGKTWAKEQTCKPIYYVVAVVLQIGLLFLSRLNDWFLLFLEKSFGYIPQDISLPSTDGFGLILVLFVVALLPAIFEELLFRDIILKGLHGFGKVGAVLLCGGLFSLFHQNPSQTPYQFCCGVAYALLALKAGSVFPCMLAHFSNNALVIILIEIFGETFIIPTAICMASGICLALSLWYLIFKDKKDASQTDKNEQKQFIRFAVVGILIFGFTWLGNFFLGI